MKIVIPGGSGQIGTILAKRFSQSGDDVIVLSRRNDDSKPWQVIQWDAQTVGPWAKQIDGADVVINLAGRSVNCGVHATVANRGWRSIRASHFAVDAGAWRHLYANRNRVDSKESPGHTWPPGGEGI